MPALGVARTHHVCCVVQSSMAVIGGVISSDEDEVTGSVEMFAKGGVAVTNRPPLPCGGIGGAAAVAMDEFRVTALRGKCTCLEDLARMMRSCRRRIWWI